MAMGMTMMEYTGETYDCAGEVVVTAATATTATTTGSPHNHFKDLTLNSMMNYGLVTPGGPYTCTDSSGGGGGGGTPGTPSAGDRSIGPKAATPSDSPTNWYNSPLSATCSPQHIPFTAPFHPYARYPTQPRRYDHRPNTGGLGFHRPRSSSSSLPLMGGYAAIATSRSTHATTSLSVNTTPFGTPPQQPYTSSPQLPYQTPFSSSPLSTHRDPKPPTPQPFYTHPYPAYIPPENDTKALMKEHLVFIQTLRACIHEVIWQRRRRRRRDQDMAIRRSSMKEELTM